MTTSAADPYSLTEAQIMEPPTRLRDRLKYLGPGFVLSASIVGSGELIATTILGAKAGFVTFWVILVSCLVKVAVQLEFGKHAIGTGESTMAAFNKLPGPRIGRASWSIWTWLVLMTLKFLQVGGIVGGVAIILNIAFPAISIVVWTFVTAVAVSALVFHGYYQFIEKATLVMIGFFTLFTLISLGFLQSTPFAVTWADIFSGLQFRLPPEAVVVAIGAFGITGVGGDEIMAYNYWLIEKGYASHTGPRVDGEEWVRRARGWIRIMYLDAFLAMIAYTVVTAAFYLLGAAVLHSQGAVPEKAELVVTLSRMYTETVGPGARSIFLFGAFTVLFSTLFSALAAWTRLFSDAFGRIGWVKFDQPASRRKAIALFAWLFPMAWAALFLVFRAPGFMVIIGGVATMVILFLVVFAAIQFRYRRLDPQLRPSPLYDAALWFSIASIGLVGVYGLIKVL